MALGVGRKGLSSYQRFVIPNGVRNLAGLTACYYVRVQTPFRSFAGAQDDKWEAGRIARNADYETHRPLKGKRLTTFCASLRSGGRRLAVRTAMEHPIGALPRTPFPASRDFPSRGNEKIGGTGYCVTYDTDSQSRNADFISIARRAIRNPQRRRRCRPLSEANITRRRQAATTLGAKPRQPTPLNQPAKGRPNPLNLLNPGHRVAPTALNFPLQEESIYYKLIRVIFPKA